MAEYLFCGCIIGDDGSLTHTCWKAIQIRENALREGALADVENYVREWDVHFAGKINITDGKKKR